jgi:hypothetical protein
MGVTIAVVGLLAEVVFLDLMSRRRALPLLEKIRLAAAAD